MISVVRQPRKEHTVVRKRVPECIRQFFGLPSNCVMTYGQVYGLFIRYAKEHNIWNAEARSIFLDNNVKKLFVNNKVLVKTNNNIYSDIELFDMIRVFFM